MNILLNTRHELRSGWKFVLYWMLFVILLLAVSIMVPFAAGPQTQLQRLVLNTIPTIPAIGALLLMAKFVDKVPAGVFGLTFHENWRKDVVLGVGISVAMLAAVHLLNAVIGGIVMEWTASAAKSLVVTLIVLILSAAQEELVFRGYPLQVLMKGMGVWPAILTMSTAFGLIHLLNDNSTLLSSLNTMLAGLMLSLAYLKTRSLWFPYGLHLSWNVGLGFVLGYPLSGIKIDSFWSTIAGGPKWLVGGAYGPEGGIIGSLAFIAAAVIVHRTNAATVSPKLRALLSNGEHRSSAISPAQLEN